MKKFLIISLIAFSFILCITSIFATNNMSTTLDIYTENLMTNLEVNTSPMTYDFDGISIAITILAVVTIAAAIFFNLIPKK